MNSLYSHMQCFRAYFVPVDSIHPLVISWTLHVHFIYRCHHHSTKGSQICQPTNETMSRWKSSCMLTIGRWLNHHVSHKKSSKWVRYWPHFPPCESQGDKNWVSIVLFPVTGINTCITNINLHNCFQVEFQANPPHAHSIINNLGFLMLTVNFH